METFSAFNLFYQAGKLPKGIEDIVLTEVHGDEEAEIEVPYGSFIYRLKISKDFPAGQARFTYKDGRVETLTYPPPA